MSRDENVFPNFVYFDCENCGRINRVSKNLLHSFSHCFKLGFCGNSAFLAFIQSERAELIKEFNLLAKENYICGCECTLSNIFELVLKRNGSEIFYLPASKSYSLGITSLSILTKISVYRWNAKSNEQQIIPAVLIDGERLDSFDIERLVDYMQSSLNMTVYDTGRNGICRFTHD